MPAALTISVIVPVFEDPAGLAACLRGLEQQTVARDRFEVIVVDNGSNPPLSLPPSDVLNASLIQCVTQGSYAARNAGARHARGTYLAFIDADCIPDARWLECGIETLERAGRDVIAGGEVRWTRIHRPTAVALYQIITGFQQAENIRDKGFSATANLFCSRAVFERIGAFAEQLLSGGDREWAWRAADTGVETILAGNAVVETSPRTTLRGALRQARRIAAGRHHIRRSGLASRGLDALRPHRGVLASLLWVISHRELSWFDRARVLTVASVIKAAAIAESIRVRLGGQAERR